MALDPREMDVLFTIVEDYIARSLPVGSRTVAKQSGLSLSPASMRNTMADLTELGFLQQPHTSAGRIPTVKAFRFYLDTRLKPVPLPRIKRTNISDELERAGLEISTILARATKVVSDQTKQISLILAPSRVDVRWREIDFTLVKPRLVLAVLILEGGMVQNKLLEVDEDITSDDLVKFRNYLNDHFSGLTLAEARERVVEDLHNAEKHLQDLYRKALRLARHAVDDAQERELFVDGAVNLFSQGETTDVLLIRDVLGLVEERSRLLELLDKTILAEEGAKVTLGQESALDEFKDLSVVTAPYGREGAQRGVVSVIGPMQMNYAKVVPVVDYIAATLTQLLKQRF
ncbi:MAG: heat-inducible transcription repressor HrcA [Desulfovibrio sp.]|nr:MAG: heat-inducible transcription repressor HrcA [Desulfovibrio sp.]